MAHAPPQIAPQSLEMRTPVGPCTGSAVLNGVLVPGMVVYALGCASPDMTYTDHAAWHESPEKAGSLVQYALEPARVGPIAYVSVTDVPNKTIPVCDAGTGCCEGEFVRVVGANVGALPGGKGAYVGTGAVGGVGALEVGDAVSGLKKVGAGVTGEGVGLSVGTVENCKRQPHKRYRLSPGSDGALQKPVAANQSGAAVVEPYVVPAYSPIAKLGNVQS